MLFNARNTSLLFLSLSLLSPQLCHRNLHVKTIFNPVFRQIIAMKIFLSIRRDEIFKVILLGFGKFNVILNSPEMAYKSDIA
jgi:hypothetical protein